MPVQPEARCKPGNLAHTNRASLRRRPESLRGCQITFVRIVAPNLACTRSFAYVAAQRSTQGHLRRRNQKYPRGVPHLTWARINSLPDEEKNSVLKHLQSKVVRLNSLSKFDPQ